MKKKILVALAGATLAKTVMAGSGLNYNLTAVNRANARFGTGGDAMLVGNKIQAVSGSKVVPLGDASHADGMFKLIHSDGTVTEHMSTMQLNVYKSNGQTSGTVSAGGDFNGVVPIIKTPKEPKTVQGAPSGVKLTPSINTNLDVNTSTNSSLGAVTTCTPQTTPVKMVSLPATQNDITDLYHKNVDQDAKIANIESDVVDLRIDLKEQGKRIDGIGALSMANANLITPYAVGKLNATAAVGHYGQANAFAAGIGYRVNEHLTLRASGAYETAAQDVGLGAGVGFEF